MEKPMRLAICDDERVYQERLQEATKVYMTEHGISYILDIFSSGEELLASEMKYDMILLDVQLVGIDGMQVAMEVKEVSPDTIIIFISSFIQYAPQGYQCAIRYILKPQLNLYFSECMGTALAQIDSRFDCLSVRTRKREVQIPLNQILYLESDNRMIQLHLEANAQQSFPTHCYGKIQEYKAALAGKNFLHCHKSYMVNLRKVKCMKEDCFLLKTGASVPISRRCFSESERTYRLFLAETGAM